MKKIILAGLLFAFMFAAAGTKSASAYVYVHGYYRWNTGTYVTPHYRTNPDSYLWNNWSSRGNYNPFTGRIGYRSWY
jgi:hypothetical protein